MIEISIIETEFISTYDVSPGTHLQILKVKRKLNITIMVM
jgi:hypothetical protein